MFTVIELLAVVTVIAILASMLLPSLIKARDRARFGTCTNNLKQLGNIISMYHDEYSSWPDGNLGVWNALTASYNLEENMVLGTKSSLYLCPSNFDPNSSTWPANTPYGLSGKTFYCDYMINNYVSGGSMGYSGAPERRINDPKNAVLLVDGSGQGDNFCVVYDIKTEFYTDGSTDRQRLGSPHRKGLNILFVDSHVEYFMKESVPDSATYPPNTAKFQQFWDPLK